MDLNKFFGSIPIFWINLPDSIERFDKMKSQLKSVANLRIEAVDGRNKEEFLKKDIKYTCLSNFNTCVVAVVCSHIKAIKTAYDLNYEMVCVFEDDCNFELIQYYPHTLQDIINITENDWEIIQLFYTTNLQSNIDFYKNNGLQTFRRVENNSGTCFLINRKGMEKFLNEITITDGNIKYHINKPILDPEDIIFGFLKSYVLNLPPIYYFSEKMTFDNYHENSSNEKKYCQIVHKQTKDLLINFISNLKKI